MSMDGEETPTMMDASEPSFRMPNREDVGDLVEHGYEDLATSHKTEEEEEMEEEGHGLDAGLHPFGVYSDEAVNDEVFEELHLPEGLAEEVQTVWNAFTNACEKTELAGEAIYSAIFEAAPSLQGLFKRTPQAVISMKILQGLSNLIQNCHDPAALKVAVEVLGFRHMDLEVTIPRVIIIRDALVELFMTEIGKALPPSAIVGMRVLLNYVGGAFIYIRVQFADRLKIIESSWAKATRKGPMTSSEIMAVAASHADVDPTSPPPDAVAVDVAPDGQESSKRRVLPWKKKSNMSSCKKEGLQSDEMEAKMVPGIANTVVPKNYQDMFLFNSAVMGFGSKVWMHDVLLAFDAIVTNVTNAQRLQEECDVLALSMGKHQGSITLGDYKAVMMASLRSLVRKWDSEHELAWSWLWENVERMLKAVMHKPASQQRSLKIFYERLDENAMKFVRREVYARFFSMEPKGQDYFKQSMTRLHFIIDKMTAMTMEMYESPKTMVNDLSAMGLRHVGYGIPVEMFGPLVTSAVQTIREISQREEEVEAFSWSLDLISRILCRVVSEGSTIVMKAINANSFQLVNKAVASAPRGERAAWVLQVQVGAQSISPLLWSIQAGHLDASKAIIIDLLTVRADRDNYYFGADFLFERHPDIIKRLTLDAPALLPTLLDGFLWRSRNTENGLRRVNYWIKHFLVDSEGNFAKNIEWLVNFNDPKLICHPVATVVVDLVWNNVAFRTFLYGKLWFLFTTCIFICSQSILTHATANKNSDRLSFDGRVVMLVFRSFIYVFSMGELIVTQSRLCIRDIRQRNFTRVCRVPLPEYLSKWQNACSFALMWSLFLMLCVEPLLHCALQGDPSENFTRAWCVGQPWKFFYAMLSTTSILLYFVLMSDFSVLSTRISAFTLVCTRMISELLLFLFAVLVCSIAFACSIAALRQDNEDFETTYDTFIHLIKVVLNMFPLTKFEGVEDETPALFVALALFIVIVCIFFMSLFIAQLSSAYQATFNDMVGYARLNRGQIVVATMPQVPEKRWHSYIDSLHFERRIEFGEGDLGLTGGIQVMEPASLNPTPLVCPVCGRDKVHRYAGSTDPESPWPVENIDWDHDVGARVARMEEILAASLKKIVKLTKNSSRAPGSSLKGSSKFESSNGGSSESSSGA